MPPHLPWLLGGSLLLLLLGLVAWHWRSTDYTLAQYVYWQLARYLVCFQWRTRLPEVRLPRGAVVVCNHRSSIDPFFLQSTQRRVIHWMVAKEYCQHWLFKRFLGPCDVIPVNRGGVDTAATKAAIEAVRRGDVVGMFPEGRINTTASLLLPGRPGAILVALKAQAPIVPCYIEGSPYRGTAWSPLFMRARARLIVGEPISLEEYYGREKDQEVVRELLLRVMREIAKLAGDEGFTPTLAGRKWRTAEEAAAADEEE